jgi:5-methylcytosine-specific restriction protein A
MGRVKLLQPRVAVIGDTRVQRKPWQNAHGARRLTGRALQRARAELFEREPLCRKCRERGRVAVAVIRDHIIPLGEGGTEDDSNIQPLCQTCSDAKTAEEAKRGAARSRFGEPPVGGRR